VASGLVFHPRNSQPHFIVSIYEKFSAVVLKPEPPGDAMPAQTYMITDLPDGYELSGTARFDLFARSVYRHPDGRQLVFQQCAPDFELIIDTEDTALEEILLDGFAGQFYSRNGQGNLLWYSNGYAFLLSGDLDKDTLAQIAISVRPEK